MHSVWTHLSALTMWPDRRLFDYMRRRIHVMRSGHSVWKHLLALRMLSHALLNLTSFFSNVIESYRKKLLLMLKVPSHLPHFTLLGDSLCFWSLTVYKTIRGCLYMSSNPHFQQIFVYLATCHKERTRAFYKYLETPWFFESLFLPSLKASSSILAILLLLRSMADTLGTKRKAFLPMDVRSESTRFSCSSDGEKSSNWPGDTAP